MLHQAGSSLSVGWYNVDPAATAPPPATDFHVIVPAGTAVGTVITSATITSDPAYKGGEIGFVLMGSQPHFSEQKWNTACTLFCSQPGPWITAVIYQSKVTPHAYYLAFEDGNVSSSGWSNDGDFNDDVFFFEGLSCEGGGAPCDTGKPGACGPGLNECSASGLVCEGLVQPGVEKCNGIDDDCNGPVDDGDLCQTGFVCDHGTCVARCGSSEFQCSNGKVCDTDGFCVEPDCATVSCAAGTVCVHGTCKAPCDGIVCPDPTVCRAGACIDPCAGVECVQGSVCSGGICLTGCDCNPCPTGTACDSASQKCIDPTCIGIPCTGGTECKGGNCVDPCASAVCPPGQACVAGACIDSASDAGTDNSGAGGQGPVLIADTGGTVGDAPDADASGTGATAGSGGKKAKARSVSLGCGCRTAPNSSHGTSTAALVLLSLLGTARRRRGDLVQRR